MTGTDDNKSGNIRRAAILGICGLLAACSGGSGDNCSIAAQNSTVHDFMLDRYYWYDRVPTSVDYGDYASPSALLDDLRYDALDRFSYIASQSSFDNLFNNGTYIGFGFSYVILGGNQAFMRFVYDQSPAGVAGIERGDEILAVNGQSVVNIIATNAWASLFGEDEIGVPLSLSLRRKSGATETINLVKGTVTINTVLHSEVIAGAGNTIGYLVFNSFLNTSPDEFAPVFAQFKTAGVDRLILDLRYNGGGSIAVARDLASFVKLTTSSNSDLYVDLRNNDRYQNENFSFYFKPLANSLELNQITVVTTGASCSASEQVVSALQPYLGQVTTIGSRTCGKPVGQNPTDFCDSTLLAVNFASYNAADQGEYFSGIPADCAASDDVTFSFGDPNEPMLQAARHFVDNGTCLVTRGARPETRNPQFKGLREIAGAV